MFRLVSKSPRRKEILEMAGIDFVVTNIETEEDVEKNDPSNYVTKTAYKKGIEAYNLYPNDIILSADTIVVFDNKILEKPKDKEDAYRMIKMIQGNEHYVYTGVFLGRKQDNINYNFYEKTKVVVGDLTEEEILEYINMDEPYDKAGAYAIQGFFGKYIEKIEGDFFNVMGLPIHSINKKLKDFKCSK